MRRFPLFALALAALMSDPARPARAAWTHDPSANLTVCGAAANQINLAMAPDGQGGAYLAWEDYRTPANGSDIYAQHVLKSGIVDPAWPANGLAVCALTGNQNVPQAVSDGTGGVIIAWEDFRAGTYYHVFAQRISSAGTVVSPWPASGKQLSNVSFDDRGPQIASDLAGGAWVVWTRFFGGSDYDPVATHVAANATTVFPSGFDLDTGSLTQDNPSIAPDDSGGCFVAYESNLGGNYDIRVTRMRVDGTNPWNVYACQAANDQLHPLACDDGHGGAYVAWDDLRAGNPGPDIYAARVLPNGVVANAWSGGVPVYAWTGGQASPRTVVNDGSGGLYVALDDCGFITCSGIAVRLLPNGAKAWSSSLVAGVTGVGSSSIALDGSGGAIFAGVNWNPQQQTTVAAAHLTPEGGTATGWPALAIVSDVGGPYYDPLIVSDGAGGAILGWSENRNGVDFDVFAQRIEQFGQLGSPEPAIAGVKDVPNDQGGKVSVKWSASYLDSPPDFTVYDYRIWRQSPPAAAQLALAHGARLVSAAGPTTAARGDPLTAAKGRVFRTSVEAGQTFYWELVGTQVASQQPAYSFTAPTTTDSVGAGNPSTMFYVDAYSGYFAHWDSAPDSGYSVDNLAPVAPAPFSATFSPPDGTFLAWGANSESDLAGYRLYRGGGLDFTPSPGNRIYDGTLPSYHDAVSTAYIYKVCAYDIHGNEGGCTTAQPPGTLDAGSEIPKVLTLAPVDPNPARDGANLRFGLPHDGRAVVVIYDAAGRRVRTVIDAWLPAGIALTRWDGRDASGAEVGSGIYFLRLEMNGVRLTRRFVTLR